MDLSAKTSIFESISGRTSSESPSTIKNNEFARFGIHPRNPWIQRILAKWWQDPRLRPHYPCAPGARMTVVKANSLKTYLPLGRLIWSFFVISFRFIAVLRSGRCFKSFLEGVASFSPSMSPWGATGTPFTPFSIKKSGHLFWDQTVRLQPEQHNLLHMDA